jgi:hypothetical protein
MVLNRWLKGLLWVGGAICSVAIAVLILSALLNEPLRAFFENRINKNLKGYCIKLADVDVSPFDLSVVLRGVTLIQEKYPEQPIADLEFVDFGLHWRAMLSGRIVGDVALNRPKLHINLNQMREETGDRAEVEERGWQDAAKAVYPLEINMLTVKEGDFTYLDQDPQHALNVNRIFIQASNIRNVEDPEERYPSPFKFEAIVFENGKVTVNGKANFLSEPIPSLAVDINVENIPVGRFDPILERYHLSLKKGRLDAEGRVEISPQQRAAHLKSIQNQGMQGDYVHPQSASPEARKAVEKTGEAVKDVSNNPSFQLRIDALKIQGEMGMIDPHASPKYRVFISEVDLRIDNLSNHFNQGPARLKLNGMFMGSGRTRVSATFRPEDQGPDFDMHATIEDTKLKDMNDLLRVYGNFDVNAGHFSIYSELRVKNNHIDGYVKPFFKNVDVYDRRQDEDKGIFRKMYEGLVEGVNELLSREPQDRTAARTELTGKVDDPQADTWQTVVTLIQNAFFKAILPGFDQAISE